MRSVVYGMVALLAVSTVSPLPALAQSGSIRGRVTETSSGQPVAGVTVSFGSRGTQTRQDGSYVLTDLPAGTDSVRFRLIGFAGACPPCE